MRPGPQAVLGALAKRLTVLLLALGALALVSDPKGAGLVASWLVIAALMVHAIAFGVAATLRATPPSVLRIGAVVGVLVAAGAGVWAANGEAFGFLVARTGMLSFAPGGVIVQAAALLAIVGAGAFLFLCIAGRATALGDGR